MHNFLEYFNFTDQTFVVTGGAGVICGAMAKGLFELGANVAIFDYNLEAASAMVSKLNSLGGPGKAQAVKCNVLDMQSIRDGFDQVLQTFGKVDGLINGAGGNKPDATTTDTKTFFELDSAAIRWVFDLNILGTIMPSQVIGQHMAERKQGVILNVSSMNAFRPLTRIPAYSAAKAGVSNFTQWLAVHMAQEYSPEIRVNAIAPGFLLTDQNRFLLTEEGTGTLTARGQKIIAQTPLARFGEPEDLIGTTLWFLSPASRFITGIIVPVDGGFSAFSGI